MAASLSLKDVNLHFGGVKVLQDVSFDVEPGVILGLVGPNGAGKTSLFNCISGHYKPSSGSITITGKEVRGSAPSRLARLGLARTFQHPALPLHPPVLQNVLRGGHIPLPGVPVSWALRPPDPRRPAPERAGSRPNPNGRGGGHDRSGTGRAASLCAGHPIDQARTAAPE